MTGGVTLKYTANECSNSGPKMAVDKWTEVHCPLTHSHDDDGSVCLFHPAGQFFTIDVCLPPREWAYNPPPPRRVVNIRPAASGKHYPTMGGKHDPTIDRCTPAS
jgi:hypothetical protein